MKRIAIVVPRCHADIVGGAEALAWQYATVLAGSCSVDVLTTTATDYLHWYNDLAAGVERRDDVRIHRFAVAKPRGTYFHDLHRRLIDDFAATSTLAPTLRVRWTEALQEEFIRAQGPVCPDLIDHLERHGDDYAAVIFVTYLYPTTYDGVRALTHRRWAIVPTLHDEAAAYFSAIARMGASAPALFWNTRAERALGQAIWQIDAGTVLSMAVATERVAPAQEPAPYVLYCGRIDAHKGCAMLIDTFEAYKRARPSSLQLVLTGADKLGVAQSENVRYLGFVDEARKFALMAGATAFVHPSPNESLSIVVLEAMAQGTPAIVNGRCAALAEHITGSGSGLVFDGAAQLHDALDVVTAFDAAEHQRQALDARDYVIANYSLETIRARLLGAIAAITATA